MDALEQLNTIFSLVAAMVPLCAGLFGLLAGRRRSAAAASAHVPSLPLLKFQAAAWNPKGAAQRRQGEYVELLAYTIAAVVALVYLVPNYGPLFERIAASPADSVGLQLGVLALTISIGYYIVLFLVIIRMVRLLLLNTPGTPTQARACATVTIGAEPAVVAQRCVGALKRMRLSVQQLDVAQGRILASRHFFFYSFNSQQHFYDTITIRLRASEAGECELTVESDGIVPTLQSDKRRNQKNIERLIEYVIE